MAKTLIIVESPSKAHTITQFLGDDYKVVASKGHVRDLPKSKMGINIDNDFEPEYINIKGKGPLINELKAEKNKADKVYLATDPDREGEAIAWHLAYILGIPEDSVCRVTFNEITQKEVNKSIKEPRKIDMNLTDAQQARRVIDRIVGYKLSPLLWKKVKTGLSAGRVQSVAVKLICDREEEIEKFVPEEYWNINVLLENKEKSQFIAKFAGINDKKVDLHKEGEVKDIINNVKGQQYVVSDVKLGTRKKSPAPPFTTSTMQQEASRKLGFTLRRTMQVAQGLYEAGYITYMRTDSTRISDEARQAAHKVIAEKYGENYYENRFYKVSSNAQDGHEGIRPTVIDNSPEKLQNTLDSEQIKLYTLIYNRFLASQMQSAVYDTIAAKIDSKGKDSNIYNFKANGQKIKFKGFMTLYIEGRDDVSTEDDELEVPLLKVGEEVKEINIDPKQSFTEPPPRYTEASLVKALEENDIGRPSTYATIISTIVDKNYVEKNQKQLVPTDIGKVVNEFLVNNFQDIINVKFTAGIEDSFDDIAEGTKEWKTVVREFYKPFDSELDKASELEHVKIPEVITDMLCEKCGKPMVIKTGRYGKFFACSGYPDCKNVKSYYEVCDVPCPVCGGEVHIKKTGRGKAFYLCEHNEKEPKTCNYISWNKPKPGEKWSPEDNKKAPRRRKTTKKKATKTKKTSKKTTKKATTKKNSK